MGMNVNETRQAYHHKAFPDKKIEPLTALREKRRKKKENAHKSKKLRGV
jgi:hypothetical protein